PTTIYIEPSEAVAIKSWDEQGGAAARKDCRSPPERRRGFSRAISERPRPRRNLSTRRGRFVGRRKDPARPVFRPFGLRIPPERRSHLQAADEIRNAGSGGEDLACASRR